MNIIIPIKNEPNNDTNTVKANNGNIVINNKCLFFHIIKSIIKNITVHIANISFFLILIFICTAVRNGTTCHFFYAKAVSVEFVSDKRY